MNARWTAPLIAAVLVVGLFVTARNISPVHATNRCWIVDSLNRPGADFTSLAAAVTSGSMNPFDRIHVREGHVETLTADLVITNAINGCWIIGPPPTLTPMPMIDVHNHSIVIQTTGVFIWGLNIIDSVIIGTPAILIDGGAGCIIQNNTITGMFGSSINGIEIKVNGNLIALNTISYFNNCVVVTGGDSLWNTIKLNSFKQGGANHGVWLRSGPGYPASNRIYWNNLMLAYELWDDVGNPLNYFDDKFPGGPNGGNGWGKGNWISVSDPWGVAPYVVPANNVNQDNHPLVAGISQLVGDINLDGQVNILDAIKLGNAFAFSWCQYGWDPRVDLKGDGVVNILDAITLGNNFGRHY